jgi:molecular chaperone GrpE
MAMWSRERSLTKDERTPVGEHNRKETEEPARRKVKVTDRRHTASSTDRRAPETVEARASAPVESAVSEPRANDDPRAQEVAQLREHLQRLAADFDNYRKRMLKEQTRAVEMASEPLVRRLLEVLDEFDLALMAAEQRPDFDTFLHGVELVYAKLMETLRAEGLERMDAEGKPFDPTLHEALMQSGDAEGEPVVADTLRSGYTLRGRVIRPAGVKVVRK